MKIKFLLPLLALVAALGCKSHPIPPIPKSGMFKVTILYPNGEGKTFDMAYYEGKHMPMVAKIVGPNLKFYEIDKGISGRTPNDELPFLAIGYFYIADIEAYNQAIAQHRETIISDFKNYTNVMPVIQISEVRQVTTLDN